MPTESQLPLVAIVGRPNVGKSTLFNRFAGWRRAVVHDEPGVTRDRIVEEVEAAGRAVLIVDTAGLDPAAEEGLPAAVQAQATSALAAADAILFLVDGALGLVPEDEDLARLLRRAHKPVTLAVNKIDQPLHASRVAEFHKLGFERVCGISAEHGSGAWDALEELVEQLPTSGQASAPSTDEIRIAVVGRPNVGKSSLVNRLVGSDRVVVSETPGTTRDAIDIGLERDGDHFVLVDTAGLRRASRRQDVERTSALMTVRSLERADVALLLIDASQGLSDQDARIARLAADRGRAFAIVINKRDLLTAGEGDADPRARLREQIGYGLRFAPEAPMLMISAKTGASVERIFPIVRSLAAAANREIGTSELNRWLADATDRHQPAMAQRGMRRRPLKFFYATQVDVQPPTFALFCTEPAAVKTEYLRFLENRLRERFDLRGTPVRLQLRKRSSDKRS
ncbi:ribosome biogenesis GTPase Der [Myxococcota bacterium]|nr:ribosome biogenesis GTPase Der [Myxococcota bacterium]